MKKLLIAIIALTLSAQLLADDRCLKLTVFKRQVEKLEEDLLRMEGLHHAQTEAKEIQQILIDAKDDSSVLNEQERQIAEKALQLEQKVMNRNVAIASTGSMMLFSYFVWRMARVNRSPHFLATVRAYFNPPNGKGRVKRITSLFLLGMTAVYAVWHGYEYYLNAQEIKRISKLIDELEQIADLASKIKAINKNLEHFEIQHELLYQELFEEGILVETEGKRLLCDGKELK